ncbi:MAG: c-type cytochrome biogenesis protein CcsB, partial [Microbacterium sp.]
MANLESLSVLLLWTAIAIYAAAFIAFAFDLARRSEQSIEAKAQTPQLVAVGAGGADAPASGAPESGAAGA